MISVIIPTYNRENFIFETIKSVEIALRNCRFSWEIIVVDDKSTDNTCKLIEKDFPYIKLIKQSLNSGAPSARNRGLEIASGDYVLFLDSDDLICPYYFNEKIKFLSSNTLAGVIGPYTRFSSRKTNLTDEVIMPFHSQFPSTNELLVAILKGRYFPIHSVLWKRDVVSEVGGFDEHLTINQDVDLSFRILCEDHQIAMVPSGCAQTRDHNGARQGIIKKEEKLIEIFSLRKRFEKTLKAKKKWNTEYANALAGFCFNYWIKYRHAFPEAASIFLQYQKELQPHFRLNAKLPMRVFGYILGADKAFLLRQELKKIIGR